MAFTSREKSQIWTPYSSAVASWGPWFRSHYEPTYVRPTCLVSRRVRWTQAQEDTFLQRARFLGSPQGWQRRVHAGPVSCGHLHNHVGQGASSWRRCNSVQGSLREPESSSSTETGKFLHRLILRMLGLMLQNSGSSCSVCTDCYSTDTISGSSSTLLQSSYKPKLRSLCGWKASLNRTRTSQSIIGIVFIMSSRTHLGLTHLGEGQLPQWVCHFWVFFVFQVWILYFLECPYHTQHVKFNDVFNWTATYRGDSDIVAPYERWAYYDERVKQNHKLDLNYAANKTKKVWKSTTDRK